MLVPLLMQLPPAISNIRYSIGSSTRGSRASGSPIGGATAGAFRRISARSGDPACHMEPRRGSQLAGIDGSGSMQHRSAVIGPDHPAVRAGYLDEWLCPLARTKLQEPVWREQCAGPLRLFIFQTGIGPLEGTNRSGRRPNDGNLRGGEQPQFRESGCKCFAAAQYARGEKGERSATAPGPISGGADRNFQRPALNHLAEILSSRSKS